MIRRTLFLALLLSQISTSPSAQAPAPQPQDPAQKIAALEAELAALRRDFQAFTAAKPGAPADESARVAELERRIDVLAAELQGAEAGPAAPLQSFSGLSPAASKVYASDGVSIGGYGELLYQNFAGETKADEIDFLRAVMYFGYRFDERWVFSSEIEFEHATTSDTADLDTTPEGEVSVEFAYLDYLWEPELNSRVGLLLVPMGFLNEQHEPTTFLSARRPGIETAILPTTWRENGAGVHGAAGDLAYRFYAINGFDASGFGDTGLRGGRQKGAKAIAEDFALVGRLDWTPVPGLLAGISAYWGDSGQGLEDASGNEIDATTSIGDAHLEYRARGWRFRVLGAHAEVDDVTALNDALAKTGADSIGEELTGYYAEVGYDLLSWFAPESDQSLTPFYRWETYDTQAAVPTGFASDPTNDIDSSTFGIAYQPIPQLVFKLDYQDFDDGAGSAVDQWNAAVGYVF